jgi:hypothetical protein
VISPKTLFFSAFRANLVKSCLNSFSWKLQKVFSHLAEGWQAVLPTRSECQHYGTHSV